MRFVLVVAAAFFCAGAAAQQPALPSESLAWLRVEAPAGLGDPGAALLGDAVGRAAGALIGDEETGDIMGGLAAVAAHERLAWSLCVMEYAAEQKGNSRRVKSLQAVFIAEAPASTNPFAVVLRPHDHTGQNINDLGSQPGFDRGEPWQRIEWAPYRDRLVVGFGNGAIKRWKERNPDEPPGWTACDTALGATGRPVLLAWIDLNALRRAMPDNFTDIPVGRMLAACGVANGRGLLLSVSELPHAEDEPATLAAALAWSARSEPPDAAHSIDLTEPRWPEGVSRPAGAQWSMAIRAGWGNWIEAVLKAWVDSGTDREQKARAIRKTSWMRDHGVSLAGLIRLSGPYVVISAGDRGLEVRCAMTGDAPAPSRSAFNFLGKSVRFDRERGLWRWTLDHSAVEWSFEPGALVARPASLEPPAAPRGH